jgi:hypothetical protein
MLVTVGVCRTAAGVVVVTASLVPPVIPRTLPMDRSGSTGVGPAGRRRRPLPTPALSTQLQPVAPSTYAVSAVDKSGRVADRSIVRVLGWSPGTRLDIREHVGVIVVASATDGVHRIDDRGYLHLPLTVRRWCGVTTGGRVLLAADRAAGLLIGYPVAVLDTVLAHLQAPVTGGAA